MPTPPKAGSKAEIGHLRRRMRALDSTTVDRLLDHADLQALSPTERAALTALDLGRAPSSAVAVRHVSRTMECERVIRRRRRDALVELIRAGGGPDNDLEEFIVASAEQSAEAALWAQAHGIGEANLPILRDQLAALVEQFEYTA